MNPCHVFATSPRPAKKFAPVGTPPSGKPRRLADFTNNEALRAKSVEPSRSPRPFARKTTPTMPPAILEAPTHPLLGRGFDFNGVLMGFGMTRAETQAFIGTSTELKARLEYLEEQKTVVQHKADYYQAKCADLGARLGLCVNEFRVEEERMEEVAMCGQQTLALIQADNVRLADALSLSQAETTRVVDACLLMQRTLSLSKEECVRLSGEKMGAQAGLRLATEENARLVSRLVTISDFVRSDATAQPSIGIGAVHGKGSNLVANFNACGKENSELRRQLAKAVDDLAAMRAKADYLETTTHAAEGRVWPTVIPLVRHNTSLIGE